MKISAPATFLLSALLFLLFGVVSGQAVRDQAKEVPLRRELSKIAPDMVDTFDKATRELDAKNNRAALELYDKVLERAPDFGPALRRSGSALIELGEAEKGLARTQKAVDLERNYANLVSLAFALAKTAPESGAEKDNVIRKGRDLAMEARPLDPKDPDAGFLVAEFSLSLGDAEGFYKAVEDLEDRFPDDKVTHYYSGIRYADQGEFDRARDEIDKARGGPVPDDALNALLMQVNSIESSSDWGLMPWIKGALVIFLIWAVGLAVLFLAGKILSMRTLAWVESSDPNDMTDAGQARLRKIYRWVINIAGIYYYISQPVLLAIVLFTALAIIYLFFLVGRIPIGWALTIIVVAAITIFNLVRTLFVRQKAEDPGRPLEEEAAPGLWSLVREVAESVQTKPVDEIRLTPGSELAVYEKGSWRDKLTDKGERVLIIGVATLSGFKQNSFRAVLAHEYGHLSNRDTAGGEVAIRVETDIVTFAQSLMASGAATIYNIGFHFLRLYHFLFRRITLGATRLQEVLADRVAVREFGADAFKDGLMHVIRSGYLFGFAAEKEITSAINSRRAFENIYSLSERVDAGDEDIQRQINEEVNRPTTDDDSHPSPVDRFRLAEKVNSKEITPLEGEVWDLFADREAIENEMTHLIEKMAKGGAAEA